MTAEMRVAGTAVVLRDGADGVETLLLRRPQAGSFPGAWVFPGGRVDAADAAETETDAARNAAVRETREEAGIRVHDLVTVSCWVPPVQTPVRFRTWFFLAREQGDAVQVNVGEIEQARWMTPRQVFAEHADELITLFPPTWITLHGLLAHDTVDEAYAALGEPVRYETHMAEGPAGTLVTWAGDEEYPHAPGTAGGRHRLDIGALPWSYERR